MSRSNPVPSLRRRIFVLVSGFSLVVCQRAAGQCLPDAVHACLAGGRYRAEVLWREAHFAPDGASGEVFPLTDDTAAFCFFDPGNIEIVLKVLDGRAINGHFWLFAASLTTVEYELRVTDTIEGWRRAWFHPPSAPSSAADVAAFSEAPLPGSVMFIGAHPDDETMAAPVLGRLCVDLGRGCSFLVATRGESGPCRLAGGCLPDLATVRTAEMKSAAALFGAALAQWDLPDLAGPDPETIRAAWAVRSGGDEALVTRIASAIGAASPGTVVTFDPRHGSTCHPAHRALGSLVLDATARLGKDAPLVFLLETRVEGVDEGDSIRFSSVVPEDSRAFSMDGNLRRSIDPTRGIEWDYLREDAGAHPSQFDPELLESLAAVPAADRQVRLLSSSAFRDDARYDAVCTLAPAETEDRTARTRRGEFSPR